MTMTIVGFDPATGQFGGAVATKNIGVGSRVLRGKGEVGMIGSAAMRFSVCGASPFWNSDFRRRWPWRR